jgi:hypothetical protein
VSELIAWMFAEHHVISAVGIDAHGHKRVRGIQPGVTENGAAVEDLRRQLVERGVDPKAKRWFVIGILARSMRCSVATCDRLPEEQKELVKAGIAPLPGHDQLG